MDRRPDELIESSKMMPDAGSNRNLPEDSAIGETTSICGVSSMGRRAGGGAEDEASREEAREAEAFLLLRLEDDAVGGGVGGAFTQSQRAFSLVTEEPDDDAAEDQDVPSEADEAVPVDSEIEEVCAEAPEPIGAVDE